jgi:hypothetical protein
MVGALGCAAASARPDPEVEAILSRGGGFSGISQTIRISSASGQSRAIYQLSNETRSRRIQLPSKVLDSSLAVLESLVRSPPQLPPDTGTIRRLCGDVILTNIELRRGGDVRSAQEECPHRTVESDRYWQRVGSLFRLLATGVR